MLILFFNLFLHFAELPFSGSGQNCAATDFQYQVREPAGSPEQSIVVSRSGNSTAYDLRLFLISGQIVLVQSELNGTGGEFEFKQLLPGDYLVVVTWGGGCTKTLGGIEGIRISPK